MVAQVDAELVLQQIHYKVETQGFTQAAAVVAHPLSIAAVAVERELLEMEQRELPLAQVAITQVEQVVLVLILIHRGLVQHLLEFLDITHQAAVAAVDILRDLILLEARHHQVAVELVELVVVSQL
jgi:hypothetical protein